MKTKEYKQTRQDSKWRKSNQLTRYVCYKDAETIDIIHSPRLNPIQTRNLAVTQATITLPPTRKKKPQKKKWMDYTW